MISRRFALGALGSLLARPALAGNRRIEIPLNLSYGLPWTTGVIDDQPCGPILISTGHAWPTFDREILTTARVSAAQDGEADNALGHSQTTFFSTDKIIVDGRLQLNRYHVASLKQGYADLDFRGALGGFISRVAAVFDFERRQLTIAEPGGVNTAGYLSTRALGGPRMRRLTLGQYSDFGPIEIIQYEYNMLFDRRPIVSAVLDGRKLRLMLDTGFGGSVLIYGQPPNSGAPISQAWLFGAGPGTKVTRASKMEVAGFHLDRPIVEYVGENLPRKPDIHGIIGMEILRRFTLVTDLGQEQLWLKPNNRFNEPFSYNRSGMSVTKQGPGFFVADVTVRGPAWNAGLRPGDKLVNWHGSPSLRGLNSELSDEPGYKVDLLVARDEISTHVEITLAELV